MNVIKMASVTLVALLMVACAEKKETVYYWGDYQSTVYSYYKND
ncbi:MAG TPA: DUF4810 domain-containing protein, partial [Erwinia persicina]|nr:DUF4810 domain-containing protein [Erwinia persicina]